MISHGVEISIAGGGADEKDEKSQGVSPAIYTGKHRPPFPRITWPHSPPHPLLLLEHPSISSMVNCGVLCKPGIWRRRCGGE